MPADTPQSQTDAQGDVIAFLTAPSTYGLTSPVERIDTHSAIVFLAGHKALKIKRKVRYDYLDFTNLTQRKAMLEHELALNRPAAPMIYDKVVAITRNAAGQLDFDGPGEAIEYALAMRRFEASAELSAIAAAGDLGMTLAEALGRAVAAYHAKAPERTSPGAHQIAHVLDELAANLLRLSDHLNTDAVEAFLTLASSQLEALRPHLDQRTTTGHVRRCHGDLHLGNIVLIDGRPVPFDALEFDETLATCDVAYDLAFLLMDLWHRGLKTAANATFNAYLNETQDYAGLPPMQLFMALRAAIRAMVSVQKLTTNRLKGDEKNEAVADANRLIGDGLSWLRDNRPVSLAIGGPSGTGKTTVARLIAPDLFGPPGAVHLRTDVMRKRLAGIPQTERLPQEAYTHSASDVVYASMFKEASEVMGARHGVILDAAFLDATERASAEAVAAASQMPFLGIWLMGDLERLKERVRTRRGDASDATADVVESQFARGFGDITWHAIDAARQPYAIAGEILSLARKLRPKPTPENR